MEYPYITSYNGTKHIKKIERLLNGLCLTTIRTAKVHYVASPKVEDPQVRKLWHNHLGHSDRDMMHQILKVTKRASSY